jgi:WD40 repeat protein
MELSPSSYYERHLISPSNEVVPFAIGKNVVLQLERELHPRDRDSSRASTKQICEYKWEDKSTYTGRILSCTGRLAAYRLYNENTGEAVRVLDRDTRSRHLIKDFRARTVDLQWSAITPFLAVVDSDASLYVYSVKEDGTSCEKYLNIIRQKSSQPKAPRISWCPYVPEGDLSPVHLLALIIDNRVEVINLTVIKAEIDHTEITFEELHGIEGALVSIEMDSAVTAAKLSPDSSALVVGTISGKAYFYIVDDTSLKLAQDFTPVPNHFVEDIVFFDNLTTNHQDCYWKYAAISSDNGRRVSIFDCDNWELVAKLRFEAQNATGKLEMMLDATARFLFIVDYDASNLFCIEIAYVNEVPHFAACTLIAFYNSIYIAVPVQIEDTVDAKNEFLADMSDEEDEEVVNNGLVALFVAISPRALLEIRVEIEKTLNFEPATSFGNRPLSAAASADNSFGNAVDIVSNPPASASTKGSSKNSHPPIPLFDEAKFLEAMDEKFKEMQQKFEGVTAELTKVNCELENVRTQTRSDLSTALDQLSNELRVRDEVVEKTMQTYSAVIREDVRVKVDEALAKSQIIMQKMSDINRDQILEIVSSTVQRVVAPSVEHLCREVFKQVNEQLQHGLRDFNEQLRRVQTEISAAAASAAAAASTTATQQIPDFYSTLVDLLASDKVQKAFELALSHRDLNAVIFICTKVDIDDFFETSQLSPPYLLIMLELLSQKLENETELKLHCAELALVGLDLSDPNVKRSAAHVLRNLKVAVENVHDPKYRRGARLVLRLTENYLKSC